MRILERKRSLGLSIMLGLLAVLSLAGVTYVVLALLGWEGCTWQDCTLVFYGTYFITSAICTVALLRWKRWGAYGLGTATFTVAVADLVNGVAALQDFLAVIVLMAGAAGLLYRVWPYME